MVKIGQDKPNPLPYTSIDDNIITNKIRENTYHISKSRAHRIENAHLGFFEFLFGAALEEEDASVVLSLAVDLPCATIFVEKMYANRRRQPEIKIYAYFLFGF